VSDTPPDGALGMSERGDMLPAEVPDKPERDIDGLTETFETVESGDTLKLGIAVELDGDLTGGTMYPEVKSVERDVAEFDLRVNMLHEVGDDGWGRMYMTGIGSSDLDAWEVVSNPYHVPTKTADVRDMAAHGWVVGVEVMDS
jgi:hypothetical protein